MSNAALRVECTIINTLGPTVVAPSIAVEEIIIVDRRNNSTPATLKSDLIEWRGSKIPVFSLDSRDAIGRVPNKKRIVAVLRQANDGGFVRAGIVATQIPQLIQAHSHNLTEDVKPPVLVPYALSYARLDGSPVIILDLDSLLRRYPS